MKFGHFLLPLSLIVAGCGGDETSRNDEAPIQTSSAAAEFKVLLLPDGIQIPGDLAKRLEFGADEAVVRNELGKALGEGEIISEGENCEAPPLRMVEYSGRATFHFRDDKFVGWIAQTTDKEIAGTPEGILANSMLSEAQKVYDLDRAAWPSPMGAEYTSDDGYSFFAWENEEGEYITAMVAGSVCFR